MQRERVARNWAASVPGRMLRFGSAFAGPVDRKPLWPRWSLLLLALIAALDVLWLALTPISLSADGAAEPVYGIMLAAGVALASRYVAMPPKLRMFLAGLALMLAAWPVLRLYNHLAMSVPMPLADPWLSAADRMLGFHWLAYARWADGNWLMMKVMRWAYGGLEYYSSVTFVLLVWLIGVERAREFILLFLITAVAATTFGMFFPAEAAMTFYAPDQDQFQRISEKTGTYHVELLRSLRGDPAHVMALNNLPGLTTFPSFHTAMGLVGIWSARGSVRLFVPLTVVNALMIASTPVLGSHYFVDVIGGFLLTIGAIWLLRRLGGPAEPARPA